MTHRQKFLTQKISVRKFSKRIALMNGGSQLYKTTGPNYVDFQRLSTIESLSIIFFFFFLKQCHMAKEDFLFVWLNYLAPIVFFPLPGSFIWRETACGGTLLCNYSQY